LLIDLNKDEETFHGTLKKKHLLCKKKLIFYVYNISIVHIKPMWFYGIKLLGAAKIADVNKIETIQSKILHHILDAPTYISNETIHNNQDIPLQLIKLPFLVIKMSITVFTIFEYSNY